MKLRNSLVLSSAFFTCTLSSFVDKCQDAQPRSSWSQEDTGRIVSEVQKRVSGLTDYAVLAGGLTNDPPLGYHGIHIIVDNGHVTLYGVVVNSGDATMATMQANTAPNVFSVDNDLMVESSKSSKHE